MSLPNSLSTEAHYKDLEAYYAKLVVEVDELGRSNPELLPAKRQEAASVHNALTYINRLPDELLLMIFEKAVHSPIQHYEIACPFNIHYDSHVFTEMSISRTSSRWRTLAINFPVLWTKVYLVSQECLSDGLPYCHHLHISRSRGNPIQIILDGQLIQGQPYLPPAFEETDWARRCTGLACFNVCIRQTKFVSDLLSRMRPQPSSESPDLSHCPCPSKFLPDAALLFPNLKNVYLDRLHLGEVEHCWPRLQDIDKDAYTPLPKLTSLRLQSIHGFPNALTRFRRFLHLAPSLTSLCLEHFPSTPLGFDSIGILVFPSLQELILHPGKSFGEYQGIPNFVRLMRAPHLQRFELVLPEDAKSDDIFRHTESMHLWIDDLPKFFSVRSLRLLNTTGDSPLVACMWMGLFPLASEVFISHRDARSFSEVLGVPVVGDHPTGRPTWPLLRHVALTSPDPSGPYIVVPRSEYPPSIPCILSP